MGVDVRKIYDTCRTLVKSIKGEANNPENKSGEVNKEILASLETTFKQILDFERTYLIQAHNRFYGAVLMELDLEVDFKQRGPVDLKINDVPVVIGVNPIFCADYSFQELTYKIIQEIHRMVDLHPTQFKNNNSSNDKRIHEMLEVASDVSTSSIMQRDVRLKSGEYGERAMGCRPPKEDANTVASLGEELNVRLLKEETLKYYLDVQKKFKKNKTENSTPNGNSNGVATPENGHGEAIHQWEKSDPDEVKDVTVSIVKKSLESLSEREKGDLPAGLMSSINALLAPPQISWKQVLRKMVGSVPVPYRRTRSQLNRRQPYRADLSGKLPKRTVEIVCCFDTSGSMSDNDLKYCINEVFNIIKSYDGYKVTIIECDAEVQRVYNARKISEVQTKMKGRGGTYFTPAIEFINGTGKFKDKHKYPLAGKYKQALMVYFTDGYGESEIPKPRTYRNLWVVLNGEENLSLREPYGDVKSLSTDKDFMKHKGL